MKPKKSKKQRQNVHVEFSFTDDACKALSNALAFMLSMKDFSFEQEKISEESASNAEDKLAYSERSLSRGEIRATAKAIDLVLLHIPGNIAEFSYIEDDIPGLLSDLEADLPILQHWKPVFQQVIKDLKKM